MTSEYKIDDMRTEAFSWKRDPDWYLEISALQLAK